jgi:hypothetical protein
MKESLLIIPEEFLKAINEKQDQIIDMLKGQNQTRASDFINEKEAQQIFKRKSTWFWKMRKNGILPYSKIGKSIYYCMSDLNTVLECSKAGISNPSKI